MPAPAGTARTVHFGVFEADLKAGELRKHGIRIKLQDQPFEILAMLLEHRGEVVTREELRQKLWPSDTFVDFDHGLNNAINRLREALGDIADAPRFIETLPRRGYRFIAPVEAAAGTIGQTSPNASPAPAAKLPEAASAEKLEVPIAGLTRLRPRPRKFWFVAAALGVLAAAFVSVSLGSWGGRLWRRHPLATVRSLAVLPFENLTGDPNQEYFVDGVSDALITDLAQIGSLRVISRTSVMRYKTARKPLPEIAKELNVDAVVEGTVARSGDRVRVDAQLVQAATDRHLWARSYERDLRDILALQNEVARAIAQEVEVQLTPQEKARLARSKPVNPEAYEAYLKGQFYLRRGGTSEGFSKATEYFQQAIQQDPTYAPAYAGLSGSYLMMGKLGPASLRDFAPKVEAAAVKALELDGSLAEAHLSLAALKSRFYWDWGGAEAGYRRALQLNPNSAQGYSQYAFFLSNACRFEEAIAEAKRGLELDPLNRVALGRAYLIARQYDSAIGELRRSLAMDPEQALGHFLLAVAYEQTRDSRAAIAEWKESIRISKRDSLYVAGLAHAYAVFGRKEEAEKLRAELEQRSKREYVPPYNLALVWIGLGDKQKALAWLEKAYMDRSFSLVTINSWPWFDPLRSDPHFQDLVRRIGLNPEAAIPH